MNALAGVPLRYLLPLLLGGFAAAITAFAYFNTKPVGIGSVEAQATAELNAELSQTQGILQLLLRNNDIAATRSVVAAFGANPEHTLLLLTDAGGTVLASTRLAAIDQPWRDVAPRADPALVERVRRTGGTLVRRLDDGHSIAGYVSVCETKASALRPGVCGFLYYERDLATREENFLAGLRRQALETGVGVLALAVALWLVLQFRLMRRIGGLIDTARAFAGGDLSARARLAGRDELSSLGTELDGMFARIAQDTETLRVLERANSATSNGILIADALQPDNPIIYVNPAFEQITGYSRDEVLGRNCRFLQQGDDREQPARAELKKAISEQRPISVVLCNHRKDGTAFWNELHVSPVQDDTGKVTHFVGIQRDVTDVKTLQASQKLSEARFKDFAETAADWLWEMGPDLKFTYVSSRVKEVLGIEPDSVIGRTREAVHHDQDEAQMRRHHADLAARRPFADFEVRWIQSGKEDRLLSLSGRPLFDGEGDFLGYRGSGRDVTRLRAAERELRQGQEVLEHRVAERTESLQLEASRRQQAENQARTLLEHAPDPTVIVDSSGVIEFANARTLEVLDYTLEQLVGQPVEQLVPERYRAEHHGHRTTFLRAPTSRPMGIGLELYAVRSDGSEMPIEISLSPITTDHGLVVAASMRDITARKEAETARFESEERYRDLFENANDLIQSVTPGGSFLYVNPAWLRALGYSNSEVGELSLFDIIHPDSREHCRTVFARVMAGEPVGRIEAKFMTRTGAPLVVEGSANCRFVDGKPAMTRSIFHDVTERVEADRVIRSAKEEAEQATATKTRFLAAASHDLRQPLQSLGLYVSLLARTSDEVQLQATREKMAQSVAVMGELLDALLDVSKLESGSVSPERRDFRVQELLDKVSASAAPQAEHKGLEFRCVATGMVIHSDPVLLQRVVENLVANAIRYTEVGQVSLEVTLDGAQARIEVRDTGVGIPEQAQETIFEEYYQLDNAVRDRRKGLGLGLAIVKHIARLLGHSLSVSSVPGQGSTFSVEVPLSAMASTDTRLAEAAVEARDDNRRPVLLLVDDDPAIVDATSMLLDLSGYKVHTALDGQQAMARIEAGLRPDVILSDYRLPGETGLELIARIRAAMSDDLPVILLTGDTSVAEIRANDMHHFRVLHKPVPEDELISAIEQFIR